MYVAVEAWAPCQSSADCQAMSLLNLTYLDENEPCPGSVLTVQIRPEQRRRGLCSFDLSGARTNTSMGGATTTVYHLSMHDPESVLRAWLEANSRFVETSTRRAFSHLAGKYGRQWREAASDLGRAYLDPAQDEPSPQPAQKSEMMCPACGADDIRNLPRHLRGGCEDN